MIGFWLRQGVLFGLLGCLAVVPAAAARPWVVEPPAQWERQADWGQTGDLIFRQGQGLGSEFIRQVDPQTIFSHVGILLVQEDQVWVMHTVPERLGTWQAKARIEPLEAFANPGVASQLAVYRVQPYLAAYAKPAAYQALAYVQQQVPFDAAFDLDSPDELYCTELVYDAYLAAGLDLVNGEFDQLTLPFGEGEYLLPSRLVHSPHLMLVAEHFSKGGKK